MCGPLDGDFRWRTNAIRRLKIRTLSPANYRILGTMKYIDTFWRTGEFVFTLRYSTLLYN